MIHRLALTLCAVLCLVPAFAASARAQACDPTAVSEVAVTPLRGETATDATHGLDEIAAFREQIAAIPILGAIISPNLGFVHLPALQLKVNFEWRRASPTDEGCGELTRVKVEMGVQERHLLVAREFARDACLDGWIGHNVRRLEAWENETIGRAADRLGDPLQAALRGLAWGDSDTKDTAASRAQGLVGQAVNAQVGGLMDRLRNGRAEYFTRMEKLLDTVCEGRGAALLRTIGSRPM